jgi:hypothetical protein
MFIVANRENGPNSVRSSMFIAGNRENGPPSVRSSVYPVGCQHISLLTE